MSEAVGQFVFLDGFCGRIEIEQGQTAFIRFDEESSPGRVAEASRHFRQRQFAGHAFPGTGMWAGDPPVRITAQRWDPDRQVVRIKVVRVTG